MGRHGRNLFIDRDTITTWPSEVSVIEKMARKAAREGGDEDELF